MQSPRAREAEGPNDGSASQRGARSSQEAINQDQQLWEFLGLASTMARALTSFLTGTALGRHFTDKDIEAH